MQLGRKTGWAEVPMLAFSQKRLYQNNTTYLKCYIRLNINTEKSSSLLLVSKLLFSQDIQRDTMRAVQCNMLQTEAAKYIYIIASVSVFHSRKLPHVNVIWKNNLE